MASNNSAQTALDLLVLTVLGRRGPLHGYGIANAIEELSDEALRIDEGSLYPALHRMEEIGWITASWTSSDSLLRSSGWTCCQKKSGVGMPCSGSSPKMR